MSVLEITRNTCLACGMDSVSG